MPQPVNRRGATKSDRFANARIAMTDRYATELLGNYLAREVYDVLPDLVVAQAKRCIQDSVACLLGAYETPLAPIIDNFARARGGSTESRVIGSDVQTACTTAAFANALLMNAMDFDDVYWMGHLGATVVAAAFAMGEKEECNGKEFITAVVAGYEVSGRVGLSLKRNVSRKSIHGHGTWQTFGSVAAASKLLNLNAYCAAQAIAIAGANAPVASVMKTVYGTDGPTMAKNNFGTAAETGVTAALLAAEGFAGPLDVFEGETGFWRMFGADFYEPEPAIPTIGQDYEILNVGFKLFPACRILQSSIQAVLEACAQIDMLDDIQQITLRVQPIVSSYPFNNARPDTMQAAQFSVQFAVALALLGVDPGPAWFRKEMYTDRSVLSLMDRIDLAPDSASPECPSGQPNHIPAEATIVTANRTFGAKVIVARGDAANPLTDEERDHKFRRLASCRLPHDRVDDVLDRLRNLEKENSIATLVRALVPTSVPRRK
jgi:2-methylcitrate dehydratase PrpD